MGIDRAEFVQALRWAEPELSRFDPLPRIIAFDDFDRGFCGWTQPRRQLRAFARLDAARLCPALPGDAVDPVDLGLGSHGSFDGSYASSSPRSPAPAHRTSPSNVSRSASAVRSVSSSTSRSSRGERASAVRDRRALDWFLYDLQTGDADADSWRVMPHLRFLNADGGRHLQRWQFKRRTTDVMPIGTENKTLTHYHLAPQDWEDLPTATRSSATTRFRPR